MDNKDQLSPLLGKKRISVNRLKGMQELMGFAKNPDWAEWENAEILGEGGDKLLSALQDYRASFQVLKRVWEGVYGEELI